ncbi:MAG TPA: DUF4880 domain-containing protein [Stenotrophomonas sp.]
MSEQAAMEAAIDWMVLLQSGSAGADSEQQLQRWLDASAENRQAWQQLQEIQGRFQRLREVAQRHPGQDQQARELLLRPSRRVALRSFAAFALTAGGAALLADRKFPLRELSADLRTATGQRSRFALEDGSTLTLDARSAMDLDFGANQRQLWLRRGRALLDIAADPRPLLLHSLHTKLSLLRGKLMVERYEASTQVAVLSDHVLIEDQHGHSQRLLAGESARIDASGITALGSNPLQLTDWLHGRVSLDNVPLLDLVERLRAYRSGFLRVSPEAAALRVQGVFGLDDSDRTLAALAETLPLLIRSYGPVTLIEKK